MGDTSIVPELVGSFNKYHLFFFERGWSTHFFPGQLTQEQCIYIYVQLLMGIYLYILYTIHIYYVHLYTIHVHIFFSVLVHPNNWTNPNLLHLLWTFATRYRAGKVFPTSPAVKTSGPSIMIPPRLRSRIFSVEPGFRKQWRARILAKLG